MSKVEGFTPPILIEAGCKIIILVNLTIEKNEIDRPKGFKSRKDYIKKKIKSRTLRTLRSMKKITISE